MEDSERNQPFSRYEIRQRRLRDEQTRREDEERIRADEWDKIKKESKEKQRQFRARQEVIIYKGLLLSGHFSNVT